MAGLGRVRQGAGGWGSHLPRTILHAFLLTTEEYLTRCTLLLTAQQNAVRKRLGALPFGVELRKKEGEHACGGICKS